MEQVYGTKHWRKIHLTYSGKIMLWATKGSLYAFFWVIPRRLKFICRRFGTHCLFNLHRQVGTCTHLVTTYTLNINYGRAPKWMLTSRMESGLHPVSYPLKHTAFFLASGGGEAAGALYLVLSCPLSKGHCNNYVRCWKPSTINFTSFNRSTITS